MRMWYDNEANKCTITADSEETSYPATNLQNAQLKRTWRTTGFTDLIDRGDCESATPPMIFDETVPVLTSMTFARDNAEAHAGTYSYKVTKTIASGTAAYVTLCDNEDTDDMHGMVAGHTYTYSAWVYVPSGGIALDEIRMRIEDYIAPTWAGTDSSYPTAFDTWQKLTVTGTIKLGATGTSILFEIISTAENNEYFYVDDITLHEENTIDFDAGSGNTIDADSVAILGHNISSNAERIQYLMSASANFSSATTDVAFTHATGLMSVYFAADSQRYARVSVTDSTNTDDYIEMGAVYIASYLQITGGVGIDFPFQVLDSSAGRYSNTGQWFGDEGEVLDLYSFAKPYADNAFKASFITMFETVKKVKPIIMDFNESAHSSILPVYCKFNEDVAYNHIAVAVGSDYDFHWNISFAVKEMK